MDLLLPSDINIIDYRQIRREAETKLNRLEAGITHLANKEMSREGVELLLNKSIATLSQSNDVYLKLDGEGKRKLISSIIAEKLCFDGNHYRTFITNEVFSLIYMINNDLLENKNRKAITDKSLSGEVVLTRIELVSKV